MDEKRLTFQEWRDHIKADEDFQGRMTHVLFGNTEMKEKGMVDKVDEMHKLLVQAQNVGGFFGSIGKFGKWVFVIVGLLAMIKLWGASLIAWMTFK
jgi:hypothetical protein